MRAHRPLHRWQDADGPGAIELATSGNARRHREARPSAIKTTDIKLAEIRVKVPWRNLGTERMLVSIDGLYLLLAPKAASTASLEAEANDAKTAKREHLAAWESLQEKKKESALQAFVGEKVEKLVKSVMQKLTERRSGSSRHRRKENVGAGRR